MNIFQSLQTEFLSLGSDTTARRTFRRISANSPELAPFTDFVEVARFLKRANADTATAVLNELLRSSSTEPLARRTLLEVFIPAVSLRLKQMHARLEDHDEICSELLAGLLDAIDRTAESGPCDFPATLLRRGIDTAARRWQYRSARIPTVIEAVTDERADRLWITQPQGDPARPTLADRLVATIVVAVNDGALSVDDASFVTRVIVNGEPIRMEAARRHYSTRKLQKHFQRTVAEITRHHDRHVA